MVSSKVLQYVLYAVLKCLPHFTKSRVKCNNINYNLFEVDKSQNKNKKKRKMYLMIFHKNIHQARFSDL